MSCAKTSTPRPQRPLPNWKRRWQRWSLGCYRLGIILAALVCLRAQPPDVRQVDPEKILAHARPVLSAVTTVGALNDGFYPLLDKDGETIGWATTTFPQAGSIQGYSGPSELLIIFDEHRTVRSVAFLASADTAGHLEIIRNDPGFWQQWTGKTEAVLGAAGTPRIVTGASLTSEAMARGVAARFDAEQVFPWKSILALLWIALGIGVGLGKWRHSKKIRLAYAVISVAGALVIGGALLVTFS